MADYDAIVIGAGHNGLVTALCLADAGWKILVLEQAAEIGGGVRTGEVTLPGFKHDLFATNVGRFGISPVFQKFGAEFAKAGLRFLINPFPFSSAYPGGKAARMFMDAELTEREMAGHSNEDLAGWRKALAFYERAAPLFLPLHFKALPSMDSARQIGRLVGAGPLDAMRLARFMVQTARSVTDQFFHSPEVKGLFTPWAFHSDFGPDVRGGALYAMVSAMSGYQRGLGMTEGGAGRVGDALRALIEARGGTILTSQSVKRVHVRSGTAVAVETGDGQTISAARAIVANVSPHLLFSRLLAADDVPAGFLRRIKGFRFGPGTFVVHLALDRKLEWHADKLTDFIYVHIAGTSTDLEKNYAQSLAGLIPERPMLIVSQTTQLDPTRAPPGKHVVRVHSRAFPAEIRGDAAGKIASRDWASAKEAVADRLIDMLAEHSPNAKAAILARHVVSPVDLEAANPSYVGGDCNGGSNHLDQSYLCRPLFGWSRYRTPIPHLYMNGAGTWPGSGINGSSGYLLAQQLLA